jgi:hypothetical protein
VSISHEWHMNGVELTGSALFGFLARRYRVLNYLPG